MGREILRLILKIVSKLLLISLVYFRKIWTNDILCLQVKKVK